MSRPSVISVPETPRAVRRLSRHAKACPAGGKKGFTTKRKARVVAERLELLDKIPMRVYPCQNCDFWHMTRQAPHSQVAA
jgi:hypothetical protein